MSNNGKQRVWGGGGELTDDDDEDEGNVFSTTTAKKIFKRDFLDLWSADELCALSR